MRYYRKFFCLLLLLCSGSTLEADGIYAFEGKHFIASYYDCDIEALSDTKALEKVITDSVVASGATILGTNVHYFSSEGFTMVFLLSESHASIHTYPEHRSCFVDLFTCGDRCSSELFDALLKNYLKPSDCRIQILKRE